MEGWTVEVDTDLVEELRWWAEDQQLELLAIQQRLERGGPEEMGLIKAELEGVPAWRDLVGPVSLRIPVETLSGWSILMLEVQPGLKVVIRELERCTGA